MVRVNCSDINQVCWAWVSEYAKRKRIKRCEALEKIIEDHIRFTNFIHETKTREEEDGKKKKK
ncbi:hypothetical protein [Nitrosopumilus sp.]|uniref:hypothetical protein n=1 Tax=Nitrosopumilus sp. TaxID=2024843 RepID=UPI00247CB567|nr:hypothetical protein [Nitrosopumilus sp.]MCV0410761.1 hypothetical protein [Nitrosopumilus sp.]